MKNRPELSTIEEIFGCDISKQFSRLYVFFIGFHSIPICLFELSTPLFPLTCSRNLALSPAWALHVVWEWMKLLVQMGTVGCLSTDGWSWTSVGVSSLWVQCGVCASAFLLGACEFASFLASVYLRYDRIVSTCCFSLLLPSGGTWNPKQFLNWCSCDYVWLCDSTNSSGQLTRSTEDGKCQCPGERHVIEATRTGWTKLAYLVFSFWPKKDNLLEICWFTCASLWFERCFAVGDETCAHIVSKRKEVCFFAFFSFLFLAFWGSQMTLELRGKNLPLTSQRLPEIINEIGMGRLEIKGKAARKIWKAFVECKVVSCSYLRSRLHSTKVVCIFRAS